MAKRKDNKGRNLPDGFSQRADGLYISRFTIDGQRYSLSSKDLQKLKDKTTKTKADLQVGAYRKIDNVTLNNWFKKYMNTYKKQLKATTFDNDLNIWRLYIQDSNIGKIKCKDLRQIQIANELNKIIEEKELAWNTVKIIISLISGCLNEAVINEIIAKNPAAGITKKLKRNETTKREALTIEQQEHFVDYVSSSSTYSVYLPLFAFLLATGCRIGEATGITWDNINLNSKEISIDHTLHYKAKDGKTQFFITDPKTKTSNRVIPMLDELKPLLIKQKKYNFSMGIPNDCIIDGYSGFVFMTKSGKPYTVANVNRIINNIVLGHNTKEEEQATKENREPFILPHFSAHILRHTFCTRACENITNIKAVQAIAGHSHIDVLMEVYNDAQKPAIENAINELEGKIKIS